jgi:hypothetical protein
MRLSFKSPARVADPQGYETGISCPQQKVQQMPGTRPFVVLPAVPNTNRGLIENLFLLRKPHTRPLVVRRSRKSGYDCHRGCAVLGPKDQAGLIVEKAGARHL